MHTLQDYKQLLDEVFAISGIIKVEVAVISRSRRLRLITVTETLIIPDIAKTESINCFIVHCFTGKQNNGIQFQHLCPSCPPASERFFSLRYSWNNSFAFFVSLHLFSESFCFSNFSISCSVEEANRRAINLLRFQMPPTLLLEIMHCARNLHALVSYLLLFTNLTKLLKDFGGKLSTFLRSEAR